ncbi:hypothetical protein N7522_009848 [Penicillium canescens]|nr:hypothetical protein N7522_009848 [Penicillium canescens]
MLSPAQGLRWGSNPTRSTLLYQSSPVSSTASLNQQDLRRNTIGSIPGSNADSSAPPETQNGHIEPRSPLSDEVHSMQLPYDHWQFRHPIPQYHELSDPTLSDPLQTQLPYDHWQFRHPIPQSQKLSDATLSDPLQTQLPYDHWQFRHPIPQSQELPGPTCDPLGTQLPYDHWQFRYPIPRSHELSDPTSSDPPRRSFPTTTGNL